MRDAARTAARIRALSPALRQAGADAVNHAAGRALEEARSRVPVRTGRLRDSLAVRAGGTAASVSTGCAYAAAVELGTSRQPPRAFLHPAAQEQRVAFPEHAARLAAEAVCRVR